MRFLRWPFRMDHRAGWRGLTVLGVALLFSWGCEAEFDLSDVRARADTNLRSTDRFQAAARYNDLVVIVGTGGVALTSADRGNNWVRLQVRQDQGVPFPDFIDVASCPDGTFAALDATRGVWFSDHSGGGWKRAATDLGSDGVDLTCDPSGRIWVVGAFMLITSSDDRGQTWADHSGGDDAIFTSVQFVDDQVGIIVGEFGLHYRTLDGGRTWGAQSPVPNDFYPLAALFASAREGWLGGLQGTILHTLDGGVSWARQETGTRAPIYGLASAGRDVRAVGGQGTALRLSGDRWRSGGSEDAGSGYLRALLSLGDGRFLAAGGEGRIAELNEPLRASEVTP